MADEGLHLALLGRDVQRLFDHGVSPRTTTARTVEGLAESLAVMSAEKISRSQG
jgi:hypothetical protein